MITVKILDGGTDFGVGYHDKYLVLTNSKTCEIEFLFVRDDRTLAFSSVCQYGSIALLTFLYFIDIHINWSAKNWMVFKGVKKMKDGRNYNVYEKNEMYNNREVYTFTFPKSKNN